jgi:hypothetical protein
MFANVLAAVADSLADPLADGLASANDTSQLVLISYLGPYWVEVPLPYALLLNVSDAISPVPIQIERRILNIKKM